MKSRLGYLLSGLFMSPRKQSKCLLHVSTQPVHNVEQFCTIESAAISPTLVDPYKEFLADYQWTCITQEPDGPYTVPIPWKCNCTPLPTNLLLYERRTWALAYRLTMSPVLLITYKYNHIFNDQKRATVHREDPLNSSQLSLHSSTCD